MTSTRAVLDRHGLRAKKSWGQNFLDDARVVARIADAVQAGPDDWVVEIGAGLGALTAALCERAGRVTAIERDPDMVHVLETELGARLRDAETDAGRNLDITPIDALAFDFAAHAAAAGRPLLVAGNLPYQITSPLLFAVLEAAACGRAVARAVFMVQREFAERTVARPGSRTYGRLSVMVQQLCEARILFHVSPAAFIPQPRVTSSVMRLDLRPAPLAPVSDATLFAEVVRAAFSTRRKMVKNALEGRFERGQVSLALAAAGIDGGRRAETLSVPEFAAISEALIAQGAVHA